MVDTLKVPLGDIAHTHSHPENFEQKGISFGSVRKLWSRFEGQSILGLSIPVFTLVAGLGVAAVWAGYRFYSQQEETT